MSPIPESNLDKTTNLKYNESKEQGMTVKTMNLCDINQIKLLLARHGFKFSKDLGQNFLCDEDIPAAIAEHAGITPETCVVEIGPGIGALSAQLCKRAKKVVAIELDRRLPAILEETMTGFDNFTLVEGDVLKVDLPKLCKEQFGDAPVIACANLPYYITTPAITALLECGCFERVIVMVQKEAAQRICAGPGDKDYSAFSAQVAYYAVPEMVLDVPHDLFIPAPKVDSVVLRLDLHKMPVTAADKKAVFRVIRAAFANRRKTFANGLCMEYGKSLSKGQAEELLTKLGFVPNVRGEALALSDFDAIAVKLQDVLGN